MPIADLTDFDCDLLAPLFARRGVWVGTMPPLTVPALELETRVNYRAEPRHHRAYDAVWLYERELFSLGSAWPLVLDEAVRLLGPSGRLVTRTRESGEGTLFELKSLLDRNPNTQTRLVGQEKLDGGSVVSVFDVTRNFLPSYEDDCWTVGVLSNGAKNANVEALVRDAASLLPPERVEFLIAGPEFPLEAPNGASVRFLNIPDEDHLPRVSSKKKEIVDAAAHANVAIFHDRYRIEDDFFTGFDAFGYDFDYASVPQRYEQGHYFPSYLGFERREYRWQRPVYDTGYGTLHAGHYVNGGLIVLKKHTASEINFNPLLLHNEAEDVELGFALRDRGVVPRMNPHSHAVTVGVPADYTAVMADVTGDAPPPAASDYDVASASRLYPRPVVLGWAACPEPIRRRLRNTPVYRYAKQRLLLNR